MNKILWVDLETTGLDPETRSIIEVAAILTDAEAKVEHFEYSTVVGIEDARWDEQAKSMHQDTGLVDEAKKSNTDLWEVDKAISSLVDVHCDVEPYLGGNSVHFDRAFIEQDMYQLSNSIHYRNVDVTSIKTACDAAGNHVHQRESSHRALDDIRASIETYRDVIQKLEHTDG